MITYLSSVQEYGIAPSYGYTVADGDVKNPNYERLLLVGYADAVGRNIEIIDANARRFRWSVAGLFVGVVYCSLAGGLLVLHAPIWLELVGVGPVTTTALVVLYLIYSEDSLVIGRDEHV